MQARPHKHKRVSPSSLAQQRNILHYQTFRLPVTIRETKTSISAWYTNMKNRSYTEARPHQYPYISPSHCQANETSYIIRLFTCCTCVTIRRSLTLSDATETRVSALYTTIYNIIHYPSMYSSRMSAWVSPQLTK